MNPLILECNDLLKTGGFDYAFCGGYAIELFLNKPIRNHGDIDVSAFWENRDRIILFMQSRGFDIYELCGGGLAHHITDVANQIKAKRNIFCMTSDCEIVSLTPTDEPDMFIVDFNHKGQDKLSFIEFLFNNEENGRFLYARNHSVSLPFTKAVLSRNGVNYLAPEMVLLYKSTDTEREGYQVDYDMAMEAMTAEQRKWLHDALKAMNPDGHKWLQNTQNPDFWQAIDKLVVESEIVIDRPRGSRHPKYPNLIYPVDYGYLENTSSMDGGGIDVWKGTSGNTIDTIICTVDLMKRDSEIKILIGCNEYEKRLVLETHNNSECMKGLLIRRDTE